MPPAIAMISPRPNSREIACRPAWALLVCATLLLALPRLARSEEAVTPPPGSEARRAICDALRDKAYPDREKEGVSVRFVIDHLKVAGDWACLVGSAQVTPKPEVEEEVPALSAVFQKSAEGIWVCLAYAYHGDLSTARELFGDIPVPDAVLPSWMRPEEPCGSP